MGFNIDWKVIEDQNLMIYVSHVVNLLKEESTIIGIYKVSDINGKDNQERLKYVVLSPETISAAGVADILVKMYDGLLINEDNKFYSVYIDKHQEYLACWLQSLQLMQVLLERGKR
jgi:hypothetical protein